MKTNIFQTHLRGRNGSLPDLRPSSLLYRGSFVLLLLFGLLFATVASAQTPPCPPGGETWTARAAAEANEWRSVTYGNGLFVAVAADGTNRVMTSPDGITWTARTAAENNTWYSVTFGNGQFVAVATTGTNQVMTSPDGITWTARTAAEANSWQSVTYGNGQFVAVAATGTNRVMTSPDGITWTAHAAAEQNYWRSITYGNGQFVALASNGTNRVMTSPDGITWTVRAAAANISWTSVTYGNGQFVAVSGSGTNQVMTSPDGITWTARAVAENNPWFSVTYGNGQFVAVALDGENRVMTSPDGITWAARTASENNTWYSVTYGNGQFLAVAADGTNRVMTSKDGVTPSVAIAANPSGSITAGTSVTFTATPTNGGTTPSYVWKKDGKNVGTNSATYTDTDLANGAKITCVLTSNTTCASPTTTTSNEITMTVTPCASPSPFSSKFYEQVSDIVANPDDFDGGGVAYGNGKFVAVLAHLYGYQNPTKGYIFTSTDGTNWTQQTPAAVSNPDYFNGFYNVVYANGQFVALGGNSVAKGIVQTSPDGVTWTNRSVPSSSSTLYNVAYANGTWVAVGSDGILQSTDNGVTWTALRSQVAYGVAYGNGMWVVSGALGSIIASNDLSTWTDWDMTNVRFTSTSVTFGNGKFVAVRTDGSVFTSVNGINWTPQNSGTTDRLNSLAFLNGEFIASDPYSGNAGDVFTSPNGICWASQPSGFAFGFENINYGNGVYVAVSGDGKIYSTACRTTAFTLSSPNACAEGSGAFLNLSGSQINYTYQLNKNGNPVGAPLAGTGAPLTFTGITASGSYTVTANSLTGGCSASMSGTINVVSGEVPVMGTTVQGCPGGTSTITATAVDGSIDWYNSMTNGTLLGNSASGAAFSVSPTTATTYYAQVSGVSLGTQSFGFTGGMQTFTVPAGVTKLTVVAKGAAGAVGYYGDADTEGKGGTVSTDLQVTPGQVLNIFVGGLPTGDDNEIGGYNGGGSSPSEEYGGGGGATDIRIGGTALSNRVVVAGGGGGAGYDGARGGNGGGLTGQAGGNDGNATGGGGGTQAAGGAGGTGPTKNGKPGTLGQGADGNSYAPGGGGGYYGGGSGGERSDEVGGGGGGSSYTDPTLCSNVVHTQGDNAAGGTLTLTWGKGCISPQRVAVTVTPVSVTPSVSISANPGTSVNTGTSVTFTATPTNGGTAPAYQWKKNNVNVGSNSATYTDANLVGGDKIKVEMTSNATCLSTTTATSNELTITVCGPPPASINATTIVCTGNAIGLTASPNENGLTYAWSGPGNFSSTLRTPSRPNATLAMSGVYRLTVARPACGLSTTASVSVVVTIPNGKAAPRLRALLINGTVAGLGNVYSVCSGAPVTATIAATSGTSYSWNGPNGSSGLGSLAVTAPPATISAAANANTAGNYTLQIFNGCDRPTTVNFSIRLRTCTSTRLASAEGDGSMGLSLEVAPNPVRDVLSASVQGITGEVLQLSLVDAQGRSLQRVAIEASEGKAQHRFDVRSLPAGLYLLQAETDTQQATKKVIKID